MSFPLSHGTRAPRRRTQLAIALAAFAVVGLLVPAGLSTGELPPSVCEIQPNGSGSCPVTCYAGWVVGGYAVGGGLGSTLSIFLYCGSVLQTMSRPNCGPQCHVMGGGNTILGSDQGFCYVTGASYAACGSFPWKDGANVTWKDGVDKAINETRAWREEPDPPQQ